MTSQPVHSAKDRDNATPLCPSCYDCGAAQGDCVTCCPRTALTTAFARMTPRQRNEWLIWCNSHDWSECLDPRYDSATGEIVTATREYCMHHGIWSTVEARHASPSALRAWAGY